MQTEKQNNIRILALIEDTCGHVDCAFEHGLSIYIETKNHKVLVDTGATGAFIENAKKFRLFVIQPES